MNDGAWSLWRCPETIETLTTMQNILRFWSFLLIFGWQATEGKVWILKGKNTFRKVFVERSGDALLEVISEEIFLPTNP
jgi:hypothetical protein